MDEHKEQTKFIIDLAVKILPWIGLVVTFFIGQTNDRNNDVMLLMPRVQRMEIQLEKIIDKTADRYTAIDAGKDQAMINLRIDNLKDRISKLEKDAQ